MWQCATSVSNQKAYGQHFVAQNVFGTHLLLLVVNNMIYVRAVSLGVAWSI